jgi:hypothetical protein
MFRSKSVILFLLISGPGFALEQPATLAGCAGIVDSVQRLECFDRLAANSMNKDNEKQGQADVRAQPLPERPATGGNGSNERWETFSLADHWELEPENTSAERSSSVPTGKTTCSLPTIVLHQTMLLTCRLEAWRLSSKAFPVQRWPFSWASR